MTHKGKVFNLKRENGFHVTVHANKKFLEDSIVNTLTTDNDIWPPYYTFL